MSTAAIRWISGPVLRATVHGSFFLRECVRVGPRALLGEVVRIDGDEITVQVYEDTTGLRPGSEIVGDGTPLSIRLGPALLGSNAPRSSRPSHSTTCEPASTAPASPVLPVRCCTRARRRRSGCARRCVSARSGCSARWGGSTATGSG